MFKELLEKADKYEIDPIALEVAFYLYNEIEKAKLWGTLDEDFVIEENKFDAICNLIYNFTKANEEDDDIKEAAYYFVYGLACKKNSPFTLEDLDTKEGRDKILDYIYVEGLGYNWGDQ